MLVDDIASQVPDVPLAHIRDAYEKHQSLGQIVFSRVLREATRGKTILITSRGSSVATLGPASERSQARAAAKEAIADASKQERIRRCAKPCTTSSEESRWTRISRYADGIEMRRGAERRTPC